VIAEAQDELITRKNLEIALPPVKTEYFSRSWTAFQADRGRGFSVIVDGVSD